MIDSTFLLPPGSGPRTNPVVFGVSEGLAHLLPLPEDPFVLPWQTEASGEAVPAPAAGPHPAEAGLTG